jgi:hypothetical protein
MECSRNFPIVWMTGYTGKVKRRFFVTLASAPQSARGGVGCCVRVMDVVAVVPPSNSPASQPERAWGAGS